MALPGIVLRVTDGNLALVQPTPDKPIVIGPAIGCLPGLYTFAQPKQVVDTLVAGQACTAAAHILDVAKGAVDVLVTRATVAGSIGSVTQVGGGPSVTAAITSVDADKAWQIDDPAGTPAYVDETADFASTTSADVTLFPSSEAEGDQFAIGYHQPFNNISITLSTAGTEGDADWKYWNGTAWTALGSVTDGTAAFTAGTSTYTVTWTMPTDWEPLSINGSDPLFYVVAEVATAYTVNPVASRGRINNIGPYDFFEVIWEVLSGGALGTATGRFSLDGGQTWSSPRIIPGSGSLDLPNAGVTLTFSGGTYEAGTTYSFSCTPRTFNSADLDAARDVMLATNTRWKLPLYAGMSAGASAAATIASAIAGHMDDLADDFRLMRAFVHCGDDTVANVDTAFLAIEDLRLALFHGTERVEVANPVEGWRRPLLPTVYNAAAMQAAFTRGTNIGWVGIGTPPRGGRKPKVTAITFDEYKEGEQLHNKKINATRTLPGSNVRFYFTNGLLKCPAGSDFRYIHWGLAFDLACETVVDALQPWINASLRVLPDGSGFIHPLDAARIDKQVNAALRAAVLEPLTEQGFAGFFSAAEWRTDRAYNILANRKLRGDLRCVPLANTEGVDITAGLAAALAEQTEVTTEAA